MSVVCCNFTSYFFLTVLLSTVIFRIISTGLFVYKEPESKIYVSSVTVASCLPDIITMIVGGIGVKRQASGCLVSAGILLLLPLLTLVVGGLVVNFTSEEWKLIAQHLGQNILGDTLMVISYASGIAAESLASLILFLTARSIKKSQEEKEREEAKKREERRKLRQHQVSVVEQNQRFRTGRDLVVPSDDSMDTEKGTTARF